jgi:nucleotide-binding universal stress UspA family protein
MIRQILFPTDFSPAANHAFPAAMRLAAYFNATITTVHSYVEPSISPGYLTQTIKDILESIHLEEFETFRDKLPLLHSMAAGMGLEEVEIRHAISPGKDIVQSLLQSAIREKGDLIVMGTSGISGIEELFKGSVASEILENAPCPVLVLPETIGLQPEILRIAYAIGNSPLESEAQAWVRRFTTDLGATLVWTNQPSVSIEAFNAFQQTQTDISVNQQYAFCASWEEEPELVRFLKAENADILALHVRQTGFFSELFKQNFGKHLAKALPFPLLGIPEPFLKKQ